ncbi:MAG: electron transfer flavoprotein subunit alpha/FixB family protein [Clostridia bacterium]|nr:electron transfer flavoprotein subunit alpha/FixB family protein [Clostridia bacterium]
MRSIMIVSPPYASAGEDTLGFIHFAKALYGQDTCCSVLIFGSLSNGQVSLLSMHGADRIFHVTPQISVLSDGAAAKTAVRILREYPQETVLFPATDELRVLAPQIAALLGTGLTADCSTLALEQDLLLQTRPAFGGSLMASILCPEHLPQMATVHPGTFLPKESDPARPAASVLTFAPAAESRVLCINRTAFTLAEDISRAETVLCGGMGLTAEDFRMLEEICSATGASLGATRAAVNNSLAPYRCQIGQTGVSIRAKTYIAFGVSGAVQHLAGIGNCGTVIAINPDASAPFRDHCDLYLQMPAQPLLEALHRQLC